MLWVQTNLSKEKVAISKTSLDNIFEKDPYVTVEKKDKKSESSSTENQTTSPVSEKKSKSKDSHFSDKDEKTKETN